MQRPLIEDYLSSLSELAQPVLFPELLELEISFRHRAGEMVLLEEYQQRFPKYTALIESIFREKATAAATLGAYPRPSRRGATALLPAYLGRYPCHGPDWGAGGCGVVLQGPRR